METITIELVDGKLVAVPAKKVRPDDRQWEYLLYRVQDWISIVAAEFDESLLGIYGPAVNEFAATFLPADLAAELATRWTKAATQILGAQDKARQFVDTLREPRDRYAPFIFPRDDLLRTAIGREPQYRSHRYNGESNVYDPAREFGKQFKDLQRGQEPKFEYPGPEIIWQSYEEHRYTETKIHRKKEVKTNVAHFRGACADIKRQFDDWNQLYGRAFDATLEKAKHEADFAKLVDRLNKPLEDYVWYDTNRKWRPYYGREYSHDGAQATYVAQEDARLKAETVTNYRTRTKNPPDLANLIQNAIAWLELYQAAYQKAVDIELAAQAKKDKAEAEQEKLAQTKIRVDAARFGDIILIDLKGLKSGLTKRKGWILIEDTLIWIPTFRKWLTVVVQDPKTGRARRNYGVKDWAAVEKRQEINLVDTSTQATKEGIRFILPDQGGYRSRTQFLNQARAYGNKPSFIHQVELNLVQVEETPIAWTPQMLNEKRPVVVTSEADLSLAYDRIRAGMILEGENA